MPQRTIPSTTVSVNNALTTTGTPHTNDFFIAPAGVVVTGIRGIIRASLTKKTTLLAKIYAGHEVAGTVYYEAAALGGITATITCGTTGTAGAKTFQMTITNTQNEPLNGKYLRLVIRRSTASSTTGGSLTYAFTANINTLPVC